MADRRWVIYVSRARGQERSAKASWILSKDWSLGLDIDRVQTAMANAVEEVDGQADGQPDDQPQPGIEG